MPVKSVEAATEPAAVKTLTDEQLRGDPQEPDEDGYGPDDPFEDLDLSDLIPEQDADRPIDQIHCTRCGRPIIVWADEPLKSTECGRCRRGLTPEWEY